MTPDLAMADQLSELNETFGRAGAVNFEMQFGGVVAVLKSASGTAITALQGAQVLSWVPAGGREVLWLSPVAALNTGKAVRGGIPVCWPWFGPAPGIAGGSAKPAHGFVRAAPWEVVETSASGEEVKLRLRFDATAIEPAVWPHQAVSEIQIVLDEELIVALATKNLGKTPFDLTQALHTYLAVGDVADISIEGLDGCSFIDQLAPGHLKVQDGAIQIVGEVDRIYQGCRGRVSVLDRANARRIDVAKTGSTSTVVWNPGIEKSARLGDMGENGYRRMMCVETANAGQDVVTLARGARHQLLSRLSVSAL